jgi:type IV secretory pathway VirD2 relaxase
MTQSDTTFRNTAFGRDVARDIIAPGSRLRIARPIDDDKLIGRIEGSGRSGALSSQLQNRTTPARKLARIGDRKRTAFAFDARQRAIVKVHYFSHARGGGSALLKHVRYIGRDAETPGNGERVRENTPNQDGTEEIETGQRSRFYDAEGDKVDANALAKTWASDDKRQFRLILSAENGGRLGELHDYTRAVMERAEEALGSKLEWFAVDHHDTDNPHTHIVLRGVRDDGRDLIIPREYVQHGFREAARAEATERLGARSREDAKDALQREALAHRPTRLDALIEAQLDKDGRVKIAKLEAPNRSPDWTNALKARAHELRRLELASEVSRNHLAFQPGWRDALKAMELHLDIRKSLMRERAAETPGNKPTKSPLPFRLGF